MPKLGRSFKTNNNKVSCLDSGADWWPKRKSRVQGIYSCVFALLFLLRQSLPMYPRLILNSLCSLGKPPASASQVLR